jgi:hypothetical protein
MIKMTIATDERGNVIGAMQHAPASQSAGAPKATAEFAAGHKLHTVDVEPSLDMAKVKDAAAFHRSLARYVPKAG